MKLCAIVPALGILMPAPLVVAAPAELIPLDQAEVWNPRLQDELICGPDRTKPWPGATPLTPRFTLGADGVLAVDPQAPSTALRLCGAGPECGPKPTAATPVAPVPEGYLYARLERARPSGTPEVLACGRVPRDMAGRSFDLAQLGAPKVQDGDQLTVVLFDSISEATGPHDGGMYPRFVKDLGQYRQKSLLEAQQIERDALRNRPSVQIFVTATRAAIASPGKESVGEARTYGAVARTDLQTIRKDWSCSPSQTPRGRLGPAICDEALYVATVVASIDEELERSGPAWHVDAEKLGAAVTALKPSSPANPGAESEQCSRIDRLRWLYLDPTERLVARAELPIAPHVVTGGYDKKIADVDGVDTQGKLAMVVTSIPSPEKTRFGEKDGSRVTIEPAALIGGILSATMKAGVFPALRTALAADLAGGAERIAQVVLDALGVISPNIALPSLVCTREERGLLDQDERQPLLYEIARDLPPASGLDNRAYVFGPLHRDNKLSVALCTGDTCSAADDDKTVKTRVVLTPSRTGTWTLLAELSGGVALHSWAARKGGFRVMSAPAFQPVLGVTGPDQVFEMQQTADPRNVFSTAVLLAFRPGDHWMIGLGPTLLVGTSGGAAFTQWNLHLGAEISKSIYLTGGLSLRAVPFPREYAIGDRVSVPRGTSDPKAPGINTYLSPVLQLDIGLGFDLAFLGGVGGDVYKAVGGGK